MKQQYEFFPIEGARRDGLSTVVAQVIDGKVVKYSVAGWYAGAWRYHTKPIGFEPTHYGVPTYD